MSLWLIRKVKINHKDTKDAKKYLLQKTKVIVWFGNVPIQTGRYVDDEFSHGCNVIFGFNIGQLDKPLTIGNYQKLAISGRFTINH